MEGGGAREPMDALGHTQSPARHMGTTASGQGLTSFRRSMSLR